MALCQDFRMTSSSKTRALGSATRSCLWVCEWGVVDGNYLDSVHAAALPLHQEVLQLQVSVHHTHVVAVRNNLQRYRHSKQMLSWHSSGAQVSLELSVAGGQ